MNDVNNNLSSRKKLLLRVALGAVILALFLLAGWYFSSPQFQEKVRRKVIAEIEQMTGGRAELRSFRWNLSRLRFEANDLTIHGLEGPGEAPYLHADHIVVRLKIISLLGRQVGLQFLRIEHPVIHLIIYPDGSTNQPNPKVPRQQPPTHPVQDLFDLAIDRLEVADGVLLVNERPTPINFAANDLRGVMSYSPQPQRYQGELHFGTVEFQYGGFRPLRSTTKLRFTLWRNHAELTSLEWKSDHSHLEGTVTLTDFYRPTLQLKYQGLIDAAEFAQVTLLAELRAGRVALAGEGTYSGGQFPLSGRMTGQELNYRSASVRISGLAGSADYKLTRERLVVSNIEGRVFGGALAGSIDILNWLGSRRGVAAAPPPQQGSVRLRASGMQVRALAAAFSSLSLQLDRLRPAGTASGSVDAHWSGAPSLADADIALDVAPPPEPAAGELPVTAVVRLTYHGRSRTIEVPQLNIATRTTRLAAGGALGSTTARLNVSVNTTNLAELQTAFAAFGQQPVPAELHGQLLFNGTVTGKLQAPTVAGRLEVTNFDSVFARPTQGLVAAAAEQPASPPSTRRMHWDSLVVNLEYSPRAVTLRNGVLKRGAAQATFDGSLGLNKGRFTDTSSFVARLEVRGGELADVQALFGSAYSVTGKLSLNLSASGTPQNAHGGGALQVTGGTIYREPFKSLRADIRFAGREVQLSNLNLSQNGAKITGVIAYNFRNQEFRFNLASDGFDLAKIHQIQTAKLSIAGQGSFRAEGSGTTRAPVINAELHVHRLVLNGEKAGDFDANAITHAADMRLTARSHFQNAELAIDGCVHLRDQFPAAITLRFAHLDIDPLLRAYLQGRVTGHSQIAGAVDLHGPLRRPRDLDITGHVDEFSMEMEKVRLESDGPVRFTLENELVALERLHLVGDGTDITAGGTIALGGARELNFKVNGQANLAALRTINRDIVADGMARMDVSVGGSMGHPNLVGQVTIQHGNVAYVDLPNGLSNINGAMIFNENRLQVQSLTAETGGGTLNVGGFISYTRGLNFNLTVTSKDTRLRYPPGVSSSADANLRWVGTLKSSLLSGDIVITKFGVTPKFDFAEYLARSSQTPSVPRPDSPLNNLHLDVHIVTTPELQVQTSLAKLSGDADLRLRGTAARPVVLGRVDVAEGDLYFNGTKYHIEQGGISFTNPTRIEPVLNIEATARVRDYDITLGFHGPVDKLGATYRSDPPLPTADIIALLALGRTREEGLLSQQSNQTVTEAASSAILGQALNTVLTSRAQKLFGVSRIKIDPQVGGPENNPSARVTIEQQVSGKVTLTFISNLSQSAQQVVQIEYQINKRLSVLAIRDYNGVLAFDVKYRQRKW